MGRLMNTGTSNEGPLAPRHLLPRLALVAVVLGVLALFAPNRFPLLTPDQQAARRFVAGDFEAAAGRFRDPMWKAAALFRSGEFEQAAGVFAGYNTAEAAYNQGNALVMLGKYDAAIGRYHQALALRPGWEDASINLRIAQGRAEALKIPPGEGTGGKLGADDIVFTEQKPPPSAGEEVVQDEQAAGDTELQAMWLRKVQTKPADFLRSKFAYQAAHADTPAGAKGRSDKKKEENAP